MLALTTMELIEKNKAIVKDAEDAISVGRLKIVA
jgi:hypothetical protein